MVGATKDVGWQLGVRRTAPGVPLEAAWRFLVGDAGRAVWLGGAALAPEPGAPWRAADGTAGKLRSWAQQRRVRLTWRAPGADHETTLQLSVLPAAGGTTIALHQERLSGPDERERLLAHWTGVVEELVRRLAGR